MAKPLPCVFTFLVIDCWVTTAESNGMRYKDPKQPVEVRITDLINRMSLEEKIGQMTQIDRYVATPEVMQKFSVLLNEIVGVWQAYMGMFVTV
ncbi:Glycoside hydrolase family 3 [Artemisia annua]|uniref:beta-glucosidase n=1 Tax=Artemisia annua TaxID=35608 RepID=A0A2U1M6R2_ARTAN|nr:Glycoside hydrolase family 3 [Artemisia annua]